MKLGRGADGIAAAAADPDRLDAVLPHRLDPDRVAVGDDRVAALRQPPELAEDIAAVRVVRFRIDRELDAGVLEIPQGDVAADEPIAVGEPADGGGAGVGLVLDLP